MHVPVPIPMCVPVSEYSPGLPTQNLKYTPKFDQKTQKSLFLGLKIPEKTPNFTFNKKTQIFSSYTQKSPKNPQIPDISPTGVKIPKNVLFGDKIPMVGT